MLSSTKKLLPFLLVVGGLCSCSESENQPEPAPVGDMPMIGPSESSKITQCTAVVTSREGENIRYRSTYFTIDSTGTEEIQSQIEGDMPCP